VVDTYNSSTWGKKAGDLEFKANLGCIVRPCLKKKKKLEM
jgi:hypothetical protein